MNDKRSRWLVYASAALGGLTSNFGSYSGPVEIADAAAKIADAMLAEEEKRYEDDDEE